MAAWRYKIFYFVLKSILYFSTLKEKLRISAQT